MPVSDAAVKNKEEQTNKGSHVLRPGHRRQHGGRRPEAKALVLLAGQRTVRTVREWNGSQTVQQQPGLLRLHSKRS